MIVRWSPDSVRGPEGQRNLWRGARPNGVDLRPHASIQDPKGNAVADFRIQPQHRNAVQPQELFAVRGLTSPHGHG